MYKIHWYFPHTFILTISFITSSICFALSWDSIKNPISIFPFIPWYERLADDTSDFFTSDTISFACYAAILSSSCFRYSYICKNLERYDISLSSASIYFSISFTYIHICSNYFIVFFCSYFFYFIFVVNFFKFDIRFFCFKKTRTSFLKDIMRL